MNQISSHFQFTILFKFSLFLQSSAFLSRDEDEKEVGLVGAILKRKNGDEKRNSFSASDIWFIMIMSLLLTVKDIRYLLELDSTNHIYIQIRRRFTSQYPNLPVFCSVPFSLMLRFCSLLTCWGQLDPIIRMFYPLNIKGQRVLLIPPLGEFLCDLSGTSLELLRNITQFHVGGSILLLAQFQHQVLMERTWKDYSYWKKTCKLGQSAMQIPLRSPHGRVMGSW